MLVVAAYQKSAFAPSVDADAFSVDLRPPAPAQGVLFILIFFDMHTPIKLVNYAISLLLPAHTRAKALGPDEPTVSPDEIGSLEIQKNNGRPDDPNPNSMKG